MLKAIKAIHEITRINFINLLPVRGFVDRRLDDASFHT